MTELTKSALGFSWAMSLFGAQQLACAVVPGARGRLSREAQAAAYRVRTAAENQFDDLLWAAYRLGDDLQTSAVDFLLDVVTLRAFSPDYINALSSDIISQAREISRTFSSQGAVRLALDELRNNYEVFNLVRNVSSILNVPAGPDFPIEQLIDRAYALGDFPDLWAIEGLGHDYALSFWRQGKPLKGILTNDRAGRLPAKSLTMMHAGLGLAFAQKLMNTVTPFSPAAETRDVLGRFVSLCKENSKPGYTGAAYESLGLVTRFWHQQMVSVVDRHLPEVEAEALSYFWHGAGRALYFLPTYFVPGLLSPWRAAEREPPHELARLNMRAGLAWATTLVNIRQPAIMASLLKYHDEALTADDSFSNGVMSALIMAHDVTPEDVYIKEFLRYRPDPSDPRLAKLWEEYVSEPARIALERYYPVLKERGRLEEVFHYEGLAEAAGRGD